MKSTIITILLTLLYVGCSPPQLFTPSDKLEISLIRENSDGRSYFAYIVINQFYNVASEDPVEVLLDRKNDRAEALLVSNHLETHQTGLSQNLKIFQIQLFEPQQLRLTRDHFTELPPDYTLPELIITRTK